jgi:hypothetical protein
MAEGGVTDPFLGVPDGLYEPLKVFVFLGSDPLLLALFAQVPAVMCLTSFLKSLVSIESFALSLASSSFANILSLSFRVAMSILLLGSVMLIPLQLLQANRSSHASALLPSLRGWRTHLSALAVLLLVYAECTAVMVSYAHESRDTHFFRMTLFGTFAAELFIRWFVDTAGGAGVSRWMCLRQPFPTFLFACSSVFLDAYSFKMISPTCGEVFFFSADCNSEEDKRQTFMCLIFLFVVLGRCVYTRCLGAHLSHHGQNIYATTQDICLLAVIYGSVLHFVFFGTINPLLPFHSVSGSMIMLGCGAAVFAMLSLVLFSALVMWSTPHFALQARALFLGVLLWLLSPPVGGGGGVCFLLLLGAIVNLSEESRVRVQKKAPRWIYAAKSLEDYARLYLTVVMYSLLVRPMIYVLSVLSPHGMVIL